MSLLQLRKDIQDLKNSLIYETQPIVKVFVFKIGGLVTTEGLTVAEVNAYAKEHPYTQILRLQRADFRKKV